MGNQNPYIEEEQTTQWPKEKVQKHKQRYTKHTYKTKLFTYLFYEIYGRQYYFRQHCPLSVFADL